MIFEEESVIVAYHEAGHAIMAIACGFKVTSLSANHTEIGRGFVGYQVPTPIDSTNAKRAALVSAAGLAADIELAKHPVGQEKMGNSLVISLIRKQPPNISHSLSTGGIFRIT